MYSTGVYIEHVSLARRMIYQKAADMPDGQREAIRREADRVYECARQIEDDTFTARRDGNTQEADNHRQALEKLATDFYSMVRYVEQIATKEQ